MSTFDHSGLIQDINESLAPFRKAQPDAMAGFGQLARAAITDGVLSARQKELIALAIGVTHRLLRHRRRQRVLERSSVRRHTKVRRRGHHCLGKDDARQAWLGCASN